MSENATEIAERASALLRAGAAAELQLLKQERKAERRLAEARSTLADSQRRLERARRRVELSKQAVADAEAALRDCQLRRAAGPPRPED